MYDKTPCQNKRSLNLLPKISKNNLLSQSQKKLSQGLPFVAQQWLVCGNSVVMTSSNSGILVVENTLKTIHIICYQHVDQAESIVQIGFKTQRSDCPMSFGFGMFGTVCAQNISKPPCGSCPSACARTLPSWSRSTSPFCSDPQQPMSKGIKLLQGWGKSKYAVDLRHELPSSMLSNWTW